MDFKVNNFENSSKSLAIITFPDKILLFQGEIKKNT